MAVKEKKKVAKKSNKVKEDEKKLSFTEKVKKVVTSYKFLYSLFGILLVCVIGLGILTYFKGKEYKKTHSDVVFPVLSTGTSHSVDVVLEELAKIDEYKFKVSNYRGSNINENNISYTVTIRNGSKAKIEVTKDDSEDNLMVDQEATIIEGVSLGSKKKDYSVYHVKVTDAEGISKDDVISIQIDS